jgi:hypothetical protein
MMGPQGNAVTTRWPRPFLTCVPSTLELSAIGPVVVRVETSDGAAGVAIAASGFDDTLVSVEPARGVIGPGGQLTVKVSGALAGRPDLGAVTVIFQAEGYEPAVLDLFSRDPRVVELPASDSLEPLTAPPFPILEEADAHISDWPVKPRFPRKPRDGYGKRGPGEEISDDPQCTPLFVQGIPSARSCDPRQGTVKRVFDGELLVILFPESQWEGNDQMAVAEVDRTIAYYASYCIFLTPRQIRIADAAKAQTAASWYRGWYARVVQSIGGEDKLGRTTIRQDLVDDFVNSMRNLQKLAGRRLLVVFIDEYAADHRASLVSANMSAFLQVGINFVDRGSPYILAHEFVHALGKQRVDRPGKFTWDHKSACPNALSTIDRQNTRRTINLANRYLDAVEYEEISKNRGAGRVLVRR